MQARIYPLVIAFATFYVGMSQEKQKIQTFYEKGQLKEEYFILENDSAKVDGAYAMYDVVGNTIVTGNFDKGQKQGVFKNYYEDGSLQRSTNYINDLRQGLTQVFAMNGTLLQEATFENDTLVGEIKLYDEVQWERIVRSIAMDGGTCWWRIGCS